MLAFILSMITMQYYQLKLSGGDPYTIVPSKDTIGHGTKMAGIIGARSRNQEEAWL